MKVLVLGLGVSGSAAARFLMSQGFEVEGVDKHCSHSFPFPVYSEEESIDLERFDRIIASPGVPRSHQLYRSAKEKGIEVIGETELGLRSVKNPLIAITGTNGKTTVTELVAKGLNDGGVKAVAAGNHGLPLTECLRREESSSTVIVLECSSFQLETMTTRCIDAAAILNITPDHLDRYSNFEEYAAAKLSIQNILKKGAPLLIGNSIAERFGSLLSHTPLSTLCEKGTHDETNADFAWHLCRRYGISKNSFEITFSHFQKPKHRLEYVGTINGVDYYNDSKGTNVDAVVKAVQAMKKPVYLIAGGKDKGGGFDAWADLFGKKVRGVLAYGEAKEALAKALSLYFPVMPFDELENAVRHAAKLARPGETVLLSPGCSSLDSYRNYAERGEHFKLIVNDLYQNVKGLTN